MRITTKEPFAKDGFFILHNQDWLDKQRKAGKIAANVLNHLEHLIKNKTKLSLIELDEIAEKIIIDAGAIPTFKNYEGFPNALCISVNEQLVHGIPSNYKLQSGDVVKFDVGVTVDGAIADTAITCIYDIPKFDWHVKMIDAAKEALSKAINSIAVDKKIGIIGNTIYKSVKGNGFSVITNYGGHGLTWNTPHAPPFVANKDEIDSGIRIQPGLSIAIEPMLVMGSTSTHKAPDGWAVMTQGIGVHFEHTIYVHDNSVEIITDRDNL